MKKALTKVKELKQQFEKIKPAGTDTRLNYNLIWILELEGNLDVAEVLVKGALARQESRGSHSRLDFTKRDDGNWLKHTIGKSSKEGAVLSYRPAKITKYQPQERKY